MNMRVLIIFIYLTSFGYSNSLVIDLFSNEDNSKSKEFIKVKSTILNSKEIKILKTRESHRMTYNNKYQAHLWNVKSKIINTMDDF